MGVRGLQTLIDGDPERKIPATVPNGSRRINIADEIALWKSKNGDKTPIVVVDAMCLSSLVIHDSASLLCGGRHHRYGAIFDRLFSDIKACGAKLVFFSDLNVQQEKLDSWRRRRDESYARDMSLFDHIANKTPVNEIIKTPERMHCMPTANHAISEAARKYGEFIYATERECDADLARYALDHDAMAVIANDSDFLVFEGSWRYWSGKDIDVETLETIEYSREALCAYLSLSHQQMPLWATLMGNDITGDVIPKLRQFQRSLGPFELRFLNVANFVRRIRQLPLKLDQETLDGITARVFGRRHFRMNSLIREGIMSYSLNFQPTVVADPLVVKATAHSSLYMKFATKTFTITLLMYDLRLRPGKGTYTDIMCEMHLRAIGVIFQERERPRTAVMLVSKWRHSEPHVLQKGYAYMPPNSLQLPPLMKLLFEEDLDMESPLNVTRWNLFMWVTCIPEKYLDRMKAVPKEYRTIVITLLVMVVYEMITSVEADIILLSEELVKKGEADNYENPKYLNARFVSVAFLYTKVFPNVCSFFIVAGLDAFVERNLYFDGVVFHQLCDKFSRSPTTVANMVTDAEQLRIYAE